MMKIGDAFGRLLTKELPGRFTFYDGSSIGTGEVPITLHLKNQRGLAYLLTAPGDLGLARAYVMGLPIEDWDRVHELERNIDHVAERCDNIRKFADEAD